MSSRLRSQPCSAGLEGPVRAGNTNDVRGNGSGLRPTSDVQSLQSIPYEQRNRDEAQLPDFHADVEQRQCRQQIVLAEPKRCEAAGESHAVKQPEGECGGPGVPNGNTAAAAPRAQNLER